MPKPETKPAAKEAKHLEAVRCALTLSELRALGDELAAVVREHQEVYDAKAATVAEFGGRLKDLIARAHKIADTMRAGYQMREVVCILLMDTPREGMKQVVRLDTQEVLREEPMTANELQGMFVFDGGQQKPQ